MHHLDGRPTAQKKSAMKHKLEGVYPPKRPSIAAPAAEPVAVDYPKRSERVVSREYTFRISAGTPDSVEVSIDDEAWQQCRPAEGFWWHDWSDFRAGPHTLLARISLRNGRRILSARRDFIVDFA
jgi:long-subunit fatty acid transport protein